jgi:hypothetical protein
LATQKRKDDRENHGVCERRSHTGLTGSQEATRTWWNRQEKAWTERQEERGGHQQVGLCQNETHRLGDEAVDEEEDEGVEENGHLICVSRTDVEPLAIGGQKNTGAERQKKCSWDCDFLGSDIWEHV